MLQTTRTLLLALLLAITTAIAYAAPAFEGSFAGESDDGPTRFELHQAGDAVTGDLFIGSNRLTLAAKIQEGKAYGIAEVIGTPVRFGMLLARSGDRLSCGMAILQADGQLDASSQVLLHLSQVGGAAGRGGSEGLPGVGEAASRPSTSGVRTSAAASRSATIDTTTMAALTKRVRANFQPQRGDTVLAPGNPPLTLAAIEAFAELMHLTFEAELTEAELDITRRHFVSYYQGGDASTRQMLAQGWQSIVAQIQGSRGAERERAIREVHDVFADRFAKGAQAGIAWYVAMQATIERRHQQLAEMSAPLPAYAQQAHYNRELTEADLDASLEMLYFMWVAAQRDPSLVTPEAVATVRGAIVQDFAAFPPDVQLMFANAQQVYPRLRAQWAQATPEQRLMLAQGFSAELDALGLVVPSAGGGGDGSAWSDVSTQSHGDWAASMVQGLAGSSYKSSW